MLIGVLAGLVTAFALRASGRFATPPAAPRTAEELKEDEIFRQNAGLPSDPALIEEYRVINTQYFDSRLPDVRLRWEPRLDEIGPLIAEGFRMEGVTDRRLILLNPAIQHDEVEFRRVLCHEMVHVAVVTEREPHGPVFQSYLRVLLGKGAFKGILASEEEKASRRRELEARTQQLSEEASTLGATRTALESEAAAPSAAVEVINARITNYNAAVRRHNDAVVEFNRAIEEYNDMVSYPDGLDRERLARRPALGTR